MHSFESEKTFNMKNVWICVMSIKNVLTTYWESVHIQKCLNLLEICRHGCKTSVLVLESSVDTRTWQNNRLMKHRSLSPQWFAILTLPYESTTAYWDSIHIYISRSVKWRDCLGNYSECSWHKGLIHYIHLHKRVNTLLQITNIPI